MRRLITVTAAVLITSQAGLAQVSGSNDEEIPALLAAAIADANQRASSVDAMAFTRSIRSADQDAMVARFDPRGEAGSWWVLISPEAGSSKRADEALGALQTGEETAGDAVVDDAEKLAAAPIAMLSEDDNIIVYSAGAPREDDQHNAIAEHVSAEIRVAKNGGRLVGYRLHASEEFKPNPMAVIERFDSQLIFEEAWPGGPLVTVESTTSVSGRAFFKSFSETVIVTNSDFEAIPASAVRDE